MPDMDATVTRPAAPAASWLRLGRYGFGQRLALVAAAMAGSVAIAYGANLASRTALWQVVRACVWDQSTLGSPLPCLKVERDFTVLRPPFGGPDTILTPTVRVIGIEDPQLQAPDAPNYFALAWAQRGFIPTRGDALPPDAPVMLAVNSRLARSQDQLHLHMGCMAPDFADRLEGALGPRSRTWFRGPDMGVGLELWTYRTGTDSLDGVAPFRLARDLAGNARALAR